MNSWAERSNLFKVSIKQKQIITCTFHLEETKASYDEPEDCDCYTKDSCGTSSGIPQDKQN